jgi:hypothetical protein
MIHGSNPPAGAHDKIDLKKIDLGGAQIASEGSAHDHFAAARGGSEMAARKMHLWRFDFVEKNSIFAMPHRRNNFLFAVLAPQINRK